ncbi:MAG: transposase [Firmicutes bacterium]|nr:transposase [Bacillota bacterium]
MYSRCLLLCHIVWILKYRRRILVEQVAERLKQTVEQTAAEREWAVGPVLLHREKRAMCLRRRSNGTLRSKSKRSDQRADYSVAAGRPKKLTSRLRNPTALTGPHRRRFNQKDLIDPRVAQRHGGKQNIHFSQTLQRALKEELGLAEQP